jgi:hypothetical protein
MSDARRDWNKVEEKKAAVIAVIQHVMSHPPDVGENCVKEDSFVRSLFEDPNVGNIDVPQDVKTVFMATGELAKKAKGSVVIELPPRPTTGNAPNPVPNDLLKYVLCCYNLWAESPLDPPPQP